MTRPVRLLLLGAGHLCIGLAVLGAVLPLLPTTPFVLLAAACYVRASEKHHEWLVKHPILGAFVRDYRKDRSVPPTMKRVGYTIIASWIGTVLWRLHGWAGTRIPMPWAIAAAVGAVALAGGAAYFLWRLPTAAPEKEDRPEEPERPSP